MMKNIANKKNDINASYKGISLVEVMLSALVVAIITGILLRNYISEKQREVYRNLAQVIVAFDKGVYDASMLVQAVNPNLRPILIGNGDTSGNNFSITYSPSQLTCPLRNTRSWISQNYFQNDYNNLNSKVPVNLLDPRMQADKLNGKYSIIAWYRAVDADGNSGNGISPNPTTNRYRYALFELEIRHADGSGLTEAESDILYALLNSKFCVERNSGIGHYAILGGNFGNTADKFCPNPGSNQISTSYYIVELQPYSCQ
jgi:type II secretory pathway pseudopilin PulG